MPGMGGPPPGAQPGGTGSATNPRPMQGSAAQSLTLVHTAIQMLQRALTGIPMGSDLHTSLLRAIQDLSRRTNMQQGDSAAQLQALAQMGKGIQQNPQAQALQRMAGAQGQGPGTPPAM